MGNTITRRAPQWIAVRLTRNNGTQKIWIRHAIQECYPTHGNRLKHIGYRISGLDMINCSLSLQTRLTHCTIVRTIERCIFAVYYVNYEKELYLPRARAILPVDCASLIILNSRYSTMPKGKWVRSNAKNICNVYDYFERQRSRSWTLHQSYARNRQMLRVTQSVLLTLVHWYRT